MPNYTDPDLNNIHQLLANAITMVIIANHPELSAFAIESAEYDTMGTRQVIHFTNPDLQTLKNAIPDLPDLNALLAFTYSNGQVVDKIDTSETINRVRVDFSFLKGH